MREGVAVNRRDDPAAMPDAAPAATGAVLDRLVSLAARVAETEAAVLGRSAGPAPALSAFGLSPAQAEAAAGFDAALGHGAGLTVLPDLRQDGRFAGHALVTGPPHLRFLARLPLLSSDGGRLGSLCMLDPAPRAGLTATQQGALDDIAGLIAMACEREQRLARLGHATAHALRADRMLHLVADAATCAAALTSLLGELCRHHGATVGRIWQLTQPDERMLEISRFNDDGLDEHSYYRQPPTAPVTRSNSMTAGAIRRNEPHAVIYSQVERPERFVLLPAAIASGLAAQVSYPIWVQDQRFGISLAFPTERPDLAEVVADIASLANTIRPALFRKVTEERIRFVAHHDDLTQLANRLMFQERLAAAIDATARGEHGLALLCLDLDGFKPINDTHGHGTGDKLLAAVAARLRESCRECDTTARIGGDEFAIIQPLGGQPSAATALALAQRLLHAVQQPFDIDGRRLMVGVSIGIAIYPVGGETPDQLLRNADTALYRAKESGAKESGRSAYRLFEPAMEVRQIERALMERDLGHAVDRHHFTLAYQPICDAASLQIRGFEALLRWNHPVRGQVLPGHFVSLAEANGLILPLGRWALEAACAEAAGWEPPVCLSVNVSPLQFRQPDLAQQVARILKQAGLPGERLDIEVTEGLLLGNSGMVLRTMEALKEQGVRLTLDDFGTAYASLSTLRRFPFDRIKIDKSFVQEMGQDDSSLAIVEAVLLLGARLRLAVVAEGVETEAQLDTLRRLGCSLVQGYLTGRPMPEDQARAVLLRGTAAG
jgi:diguanylate cyclase (GGDEF)-like protein